MPSRRRLSLPVYHLVDNEDFQVYMRAQGTFQQLGEAWVVVEVGTDVRPRFFSLDETHLYALSSNSANTQRNGFSVLPCSTHRFLMSAVPIQRVRFPACTRESTPLLWSELEIYNVVLNSTIN